MKTKINGAEMVKNSLIGVGKFNKFSRQNDVKTVLAAINDRSEIKAELDGSLLKIDCSHTFEAEPEIHAAISNLVNGHVTRTEKENLNDGYRTVKSYLIVDLLQPRN